MHPYVAARQPKRPLPWILLTKFIYSHIYRPGGRLFVTGHLTRKTVGLFEFIFFKSARFCQNTLSRGPRRGQPKKAETTKASANNEFPFNRDLKNNNEATKFSLLPRNFVRFRARYGRPVKFTHIPYIYTLGRKFDLNERGFYPGQFKFRRV